MRRLYFSRVLPLNPFATVINNEERGMANANCTVYFRENGTSKMYSAARANGREGSFGIRWYEDKRQRQKIVGEYSAATAAKLRKEIELMKASSPKANSLVLEGTTTLDSAIVRSIYSVLLGLDSSDTRRL
jgi:hypothetical protein